MIRTIQINFISEVLPAPYAHQCQMDITLLQDKISLKVALIYLDRASLTAEEIWEEGFNEEDDFSWEGELDLAWKSYLETWVKKEDLGPASPPGESIEVKIEGNDFHKTISNKKKWVYMMQEMLQAVYEADGLEAPLLLRFAVNGRETGNKEYRFRYSFQYLSVTIDLNENKHQKSIKGDWEDCAALLREVFIPDYEEEQFLKDGPDKEGVYVDPGHGVWYPAEAIKMGKKKYAIDKIEKMLAQMMQRYDAPVNNPW